MTMRTASRGIVENPVSWTGSGRRIWPLGRGSHGWLAVLRWTGVVLLVILAWAGVLLWYAFLTFIPVLWFGWAFYTLRRRHFIYDQRRFGRAIAD